MEALFPNGWAHYLAGGVIMGIGMSLLFLSTGLIGGMSTVFTSVWSYFSRAPFFQEGRFVSSRRWRLVYAAALIAGALLWLACCGLPLQPASILSVLLFLATAMITARVVAAFA